MSYNMKSKFDTLSLNEGIPVDQLSLIVSVKNVNGYTIIACRSSISIYNSNNMTLLWYLNKPPLITVTSMEVISDRTCCVSYSNNSIDFFDFKCNECIKKQLKINSAIIKLIHIDHILYILCKKKVLVFNVETYKVEKCFNVNGFRINTHCCHNIKGDLLYQKKNKKIIAYSICSGQIIKEATSKMLFDSLQVSFDGRILMGINNQRRKCVIEWWDCAKMRYIGQYTFPFKVSYATNYLLSYFLINKENYLIGLNPFEPEKVITKLLLPQKPSYIININEILISQFKGGEIKSFFLPSFKVVDIYSILSNSDFLNQYSDMKDFNNKLTNLFKGSLDAIISNYEAALSLGEKEIHNSQFVLKSSKLLSNFRNCCRKNGLFNHELDNNLTMTYLKYKEMFMKRISIIRRDLKYR